MNDVNKSLILLVDDVPANLHVLVSALKADYRLKIATDGAEALSIIQWTEKPQLIVLDVMMPGMSGIEVFRQLRAKPETANIPVIFVSADTSEQSQLDGLDLGADDYLTKPVLSAVLRARVRNSLQRKRAEMQLRLAAHVFEHSGEAILITDRHNRIMEVNPAFVQLTGYSLEDVRGQDPRILAAGSLGPEFYDKMWHSIRERGFWQGEMWDRAKNGSVYPKWLTISVVRNAQGDIDYFIGSFINISEQKATEDRIRHAAHHDVLTGLPNRLYLQVTLERGIANARRERRELAVMFIDLDRFKVINDTLGHHIGDGLLVEVANRLKGCVRDNDLVARLGGDEFVVVLNGEHISNASAQVANKILTRLSVPCVIHEHELYTTPSIGISLYPQDGESPDLLMKHADTAMYHAKEAGRSQYQFFTETTNRRTREHLALENSLHQALANREFLLYYQPQADVATGRLLGAEALIRWRHPERGLVAPDQFIPLAEETGLILPIGEWVLDEVCRQLQQWRDEGLPLLTIAVNLSARQFRQERLVERILAILSNADVSPRAIELEITETTIMERAESAAAVLRNLHDHGFRIAIDDFGTGYSSLGYLKRFPVDNLKIDRSFIMDIPHDSNDAAIASAVIQMAKSLGLKVVAEGVETAQQRDFLRQQGCSMFQGYWLSRPLDAATFAESFLRGPVLNGLAKLF